MLLPDAVFPAASAPTVGHAILTRFNLRIFRDASKSFAPADHDRWLAHRIDEFRRVCLPSVLAQTKRPDLWLLGMDGLARDAVAEVVEMVQDHPWIVPAWQGAKDSARSVFERELTEFVRQFDAVTTTRLDNDDAIALRFVSDVDEYVKAAFAGESTLDDFWVLFPSGAKLAEGEFYHYMHSRPHFLTRATRGRPVGHHVNTVNHTRIYEDGRRVFTPVSSQPMWLQNVHGENLNNRVRRSDLRLHPPQRVAALFGLDGVVQSEGAAR